MKAISGGSFFGRYYIIKASDCAKGINKIIADRLIVDAGNSKGDSILHVRYDQSGAIQFKPGPKMMLLPFDSIMNRL